MEKVNCEFIKEKDKFIMKHKDKMLIWFIPGDLDLCWYYINIDNNINSPFIIYKECDLDLYNIFIDIFDGIDSYVEEKKKTHPAGQPYETLLNKEKDTIRYINDKAELSKAAELIIKKDNDKIEVSFVDKKNSWNIFPEVQFHSRYGSRYDNANRIFYDKYYEIMKKYRNDKTKVL